MKKRVLAALLAASMALCAGCGSQTSDDGEEQTAAGTAVEVAEVTKGAMSTEYSVNGKVAADNEVQVFPMLAGQVLTLSVSEGDKVTKGQTLLNVDTSSVTSTMSSLRESYNATKTATEKAIENAQIGVEQAQLAVENTEALLEAGAAAEQDLTKAKQGLAQAQAGVQQASAQQAAPLAQIQARMDQINKQASYGTVTAPCAGTVTAVNVVQGGMASSAQPAVVIAEDSRVKINASVSEDVFAGLHTGDSAGVQISVLSDEVKSAKIVSLPAAANQQTKLYTVTLSVPAEVEGLLSGMFADVIFRTDVSENALVIPTEAILTNGQTQYVYVVEEDTARYTEVTTGLTGNGVTEITSGLTEGEQLVTVGQTYLSDGDPVRIVSGEA